jgi:hypothetical protein
MYSDTYNFHFFSHLYTHLDVFTQNSFGSISKILPTVFVFNLCGGSMGTAATTSLLYQPRMIGDGDCGEIGGIKVGRGN